VVHGLQRVGAIDRLEVRRCSRLGDLGAPLGIVTAWGFVSFVVALQIFRWR